MTYADFLLLFLVLPLSVLVIFLRRRLLDQRYLVSTGILMLVALVYMAPWDHMAAVWGLWTWANNQTWDYAGGLFHQRNTFSACWRRCWRLP